jgi:DinB superfamily
MVAVVEIPPDTKDWTWVLHRQCPECGLDTRDVHRDDVAAMLRDNAADWMDVLERPNVRDRPSPIVWSPLEYACHVRDACRVYNGRLRLMLTQDDPLFENWDQDATAVADQYGEQAPGAVAVELLSAAHALADHFDAVVGDEWDRTGTRSDGAQFTVESLGRYFVHDVAHHIYDVTSRRYDIST